ncbi:hypothetical protein EKG38_21045 [Shewanella canadensis]|uniref:HEAT repeat domain-containing protein n=1 Tax=Shewanella canadensis TaxID=271096 RepID=A0A431WNG5_9GAMM|nr:hypothetical protein [Shewanella canadensis]RTR36977.1 hypothetical protein EKG38_21045 [Shewanella canadensis]
MIKHITLALVLTLSSVAGQALAETFTEAEYVAIFNGDDINKQKQAIDSLVLAGLSDPKVFDTLHAKFKASLPQAVNNASIDYSAWLLKGLAYSGDEKYQQTFNEIIAGDYPGKLKKYAKKSIPTLKQYKSWTPILSDKSQYAASETREVNVIANALRSDELELKRYAAKRMINHSLYAPHLLSILDSELKEPRLLKHEKLSINTYAYMAKALASSGNPEYKVTLEHIAAHSSEKKLQKYAKKYLKTYY